MKIGVVTLSLGHNIGGILQNWALQQSLIRLGYLPLTLHQHHKPIVVWRFYLRFLLECLKVFKRRLCHQYERYPSISTVSHKFYNGYNKTLRRFMLRNINMTERLDNCNEFEGLGAYIVGSDQVWRPCYAGAHLQDMYLRFVKNPAVKRIAYGASFGVDVWEYSDEQTAICGEEIKKFDAVSVRELSGVKLCRDNFGVSATHVLDPTLLLDASDYLPLCEGVRRRKNFVGTYILDIDSKKKRTAEDIALQMNLEIRHFNPDKGSIEEWLAMFRDASYIVTDSFHGSVFSILFRKQFLVLSNGVRGQSRFESLLRTFNLESRILTDINLGHNQNYGLNIKWDDVFDKLEEERTKSLNFITKSLL